MAIVLNILKWIVRWTWKIWAGFSGIFVAFITLGILTKCLQLDPPETNLIWSGPFKALLKKK